MCFSASASFTTAAFLALVGVITIIRNRQTIFVLFASIPLLFAFQQFFEGVVWLSLTNPQYAMWESVMTKLFLFFAFVIWPIWIPLSLLCAEKQMRARQLLRYCLSIGTALALFLLIFLLKQPIVARIQTNNIDYHFSAPFEINFTAMLLYLIAIVVPFFISTHRLMRWFGTLFAVSFAISYLFYTQTHISVWCFFAAILSICVFALVPKER